MIQRKRDRVTDTASHSRKRGRGGCIENWQIRKDDSGRGRARWRMTASPRRNVVRFPPSSDKRSVRLWTLELPESSTRISSHPRQPIYPKSRTGRAMQLQTLLILDLDETLIFASEKPLERQSDFKVGAYDVYRRPFLEEFLKTCSQTFQIAVWSSSGTNYLEAVTEAIFPAEISPVFIWGRERCVQRYDPELLETYFAKDLKKVKRLGFSLDRVLIVEDTPQKVQRNFGNAIYVCPFFGDPNDIELQNLGKYLPSLSAVPNVRCIEKRGWRTQV